MLLLPDAQCDLKEKLFLCPNADKGLRCLVVSGDGAASFVHLHTGSSGEVCTLSLLNHSVCC